MFLQILQRHVILKNLRFLADLARIFNCRIRFVDNFSISFSSGQDISGTKVLDQRLVIRRHHSRLPALKFKLTSTIINPFRFPLSLNHTLFLVKYGTYNRGRRDEIFERPNFVVKYSL
jgi:hypothetical protein